MFLQQQNMRTAWRIQMKAKMRTTLFQKSGSRKSELKKLLKVLRKQHRWRKLEKPF